MLGDDREFTAGLVAGHSNSGCPYSDDGRLRFGHDALGGSFTCIDTESGLVLARVTSNVIAPGPFSSDGSCSSGYSHGWTSVDMVITNNTPFTLNFEGDLSGPSAGHWHQRPAQVLEPGQCEVVNAYASTDVDIFNLNVVYSTTWGDYVPFSGTANGTAPTFNPNVFDGVPQYHASGQYWSGSIDSRYTITSSGQVGQFHTHFNLILS